MKRLFALSLVALFAMTASAWSGGFLCGLHCKDYCMVPPPPKCPDCSCPCDHRLNLCPEWKSAHAQKLIEDLDSCCCCDRIKTVRKLGHRLHADFCNDPCVLEVLISSLQCDKCWEVRREAAWGIQRQNARTEQGVLALYIASKLDPHYVVRVAATEALDILTIAHRECFTETLKSGDELIKQLKAQGYKPGSDNCRVAFGGCGIDHSAPPSGTVTPVNSEPIPAPKAPPAKVKPAGFEFTDLPRPQH
jgi:hypothetical protein